MRHDGFFPGFGFACVILSAVPAVAQSLVLTEIGRLEAPVQVMTAADAMLALADGATLRVAELDATGAPTVVGQRDFEQPLLALAFDLDRDALYVANSHDGLVRLDLGDPSALAVTGRSPTRGQNNGVVGSGDHVFAGDNSIGVDVIRTTGGGLTRVGEYLTDGFPRAIGASGSLLLVADQPGGLVVLDVSGAAPAPIGVVSSLGTDRLAQVAAPPAESIDERPPSFALARGPATGLQVVDLNDPSNPALVSRLEPAGPVAIWEDTAYVVAEGVLTGWGLDDLDRPERLFTAEAPAGVRWVSATTDALWLATPEVVVVFARPMR